MATGTASGGHRLPRGSAVFTTFPDLLFIFEFVSGGLVWILILLTQVPVPLVQGWVLFVSVSCFVVTTLLLFLYTVGAHKNWNFWITLDTAYHCLAALFYFSASALETLVTIGLQDDIYRHYSENISAVQPENAGAVITPISQTGDQGPESLHNPPRGDQELEGPGVQAKCSVTHTLSTNVFSIIATLLYMVHAVFSLIRCKVSYRNREHS